MPRAGIPGRIEAAATALGPSIARCRPGFGVEPLLHAWRTRALSGGRFLSGSHSPVSGCGEFSFFNQACNNAGCGRV